MTADVAPSLLVDLYELTMVDVYRREGMADRTATFSLFVRSLPPERGYLVAAGLHDALDWLEHLRFGPDELEAIGRLGLFEPAFLDWLADRRFTGTVRGVPEGTVVFAEEPILEVEGPIAEAQLAETFLLNQVTLQTLLATKAARCRYAAGTRPVVDFALRRSHGIDAGMKLARICGLVGLAGTSNVGGADRYGVPASGTMAHAFVQAYEDETEAFRAFAAAFGEATILLVDTYDTRRGVERATLVAEEMRGRGVELRGIRLDSGDLAAEARFARAHLDGAGFPAVQIYASGGLDEYEIHRLLEVEHAPIDGFGVGSSLGASVDAPTLDTVYKLVAYDGRPVRKTSPGKITWPGAKQVWRSAGGEPDVLALADEAPPGPHHEPLLEVVMAAGRRTAQGRRTLGEARAHFERQWKELPETILRLHDAEPGRVEASTALRQIAADLDGKDDHDGHDDAELR